MLRLVRTIFSPKLFILQTRLRSELRPVKSERTVSFLKENGFSEAHITQITQIRPLILLADPKKNLAPKLEFFRSLGISNTDLCKIIASSPFILESSLKNQLIPCHRYLKFLLHTDKNVAKLIKRRSWIVRCNIDKILAPNFSLLSKIGVPESRIQYFLVQYADACAKNHTYFKRKIEEVINLGFGTMLCSFIDVLNLLCIMSKTTFDRKWAAYKKENLSDDEIQSAFLIFPKCMKYSEAKITRTMNFLVNKMGFEVVNIASWPVFIGYSLEKRIIPRCRVIKVLQSLRVLKKDITLPTILVQPETQFLNKFVCNYENKVPGLLKIYEGKDTGSGSDY